MPSPSRSPSSPRGSRRRPGRRRGPRASFGHRSSTSRMPSLSLSGSGQPSLVLRSRRSPRARPGTCLTSSLMPSPSRSPIEGSKMNPTKARTSRGLEAGRRVARAGAEHEVAVALDEHLDAADDLVRGLHACCRHRRQQVGAVGVGNDVDRLEDAVGETEAVGDAVAVAEAARRRPGRQIVSRGARCDRGSPRSRRS